MAEQASTADLRRAISPDEAARALAWQSEQSEIAGRRVALLDMLRGNPEKARDLEERWAALRPDPEQRSQRVVEL
jgi:hypothetical protein